MPGMTWTEIDEGLPDAQRLFQSVNRSRFEVCIYYRTPDITLGGEDHEQAGWVTIGDSQGAKMGDMAHKGFVPLHRFGSVGSNSKNKWESILRHPEGPGQFPLSQILAYRWFDARNLRHDWPTMPARVNPARFFPALRAYAEELAKHGQTLQLYGCPDCHNRAWLEPRSLFYHLRNHHDYEVSDIFSWGQQMGIDFRRTLHGSAVKDVPLLVDGEDEDDDDVIDVTLPMAQFGGNNTERGAHPQATSLPGHNAARKRDPMGRLLPKSATSGYEAPQDEDESQ